MEDMRKDLDRFIEVFKDTDTYKKYVQQKQNLLQYPELKKKVDEYREKNYIFQQRSSADEIFEESDRYIVEMEEIRKDPIVHEFLKTELAFCRMVQKINEYFLETVSMEFE